MYEESTVLGIAGENGIEYVRAGKYLKVYEIDLNKEYLAVVQQRYSNLAGVLNCLQMDLLTETDKLPKADLVIANLLIEYIGDAYFKKLPVVATAAVTALCTGITVKFFRWE